MALLAPRSTAPASAQSPSAPLYEYRIERGWLRMADGVRLAVTYWRPQPRTPGERFPVLLEYLPYRKDDSFYQRDYPLYSWFVRRGFIMAKVDIRGTGSSEGHLPPREYSDEEQADGDSVIAQLARLPGSNGAVGMWGISWGGFNAIQMAMRRPPALKAIVALMATDDLYKDDVHYIDGVLHLDQYALQIDHENGLPAPPEYRTDAAYFRNRFDAEPWIFTYLRHSTDSDWWRRKSLRFQYDAITIPCYLIGGLLDGYRDAIPRMLDSVRAPVKGEIGPWKHDFPHDALPGPSYEWREQAVRWWNHWLRGEDTGLMAEPRLTVFVRDGHPPDPTLQLTPGQWRFEDWPIARARTQQLFPAADGRLVEQPGASGAWDQLRYIAGSGTGVPVWWGDATGNMAADDGTSLVYDSAPLTDPLEMIGFPRIHLRVSAPVPIADWTVRLEDVAPDGQVSLVTGTLISGAQRESRTAPTPLVPGEEYDLTAELHFSTWTFHPGHRIRLAVANAQFPMAWPTPAPMTTRLAVGDGRTRLELPIVPPAPDPRVPPRPAPSPHDEAPDARTLVEGGYPGAVVTRDANAKTTAVDFWSHWRYAIGTRTIDVHEKERYETSDDNPAASRFVGEESHEFRLPGGRVVKVSSAMEVRSDSTHLHVSFTRRLHERGRLVRTRRWAEAIPRGIH